VIIIKPDGLRFWLTFYAQRFFMLPLVWSVFRVFNEVEVVGAENFAEVEGESVILAPNHTTAWDAWVGTVWALSSRRRLVERDSYMAVLAAPENIPTPMLRTLTACLGAIPIDREQGVDQKALTDIVRVVRERKKKVILTVYPEGTRSKNGKLRRRGKPGLGWLQHQTGVTVVPIYHTGGKQMPGVGLKMRVRVGKPIRLESYRGAPDELSTWRGITDEVMRSLRDLEAEEHEHWRLQHARRLDRQAKKLARRRRRSSKDAARLELRETVGASQSGRGSGCEGAA